MHIQAKIVNPLVEQLQGIPKYQSTSAAGLDLIACIEHPLVLEPGTTQLIGSGIAIYIQDSDYMGVIVPRSGLGHKHGIVLGNTVGIIDADYQGELKLSCWNRSSTPFTIEPGMRLAQLIIQPIKQVGLNWVESFEESERGDRGFGSTGLHTKKEETVVV